MRAALSSMPLPGYADQADGPSTVPDPTPSSNANPITHPYLRDIIGGHKIQIVLQHFLIYVDVMKKSNVAESQKRSLINNAAMFIIVTWMKASVACHLLAGQFPSWPTLPVLLNAVINSLEAILLLGFSTEAGDLTLNDGPGIYGWKRRTSGL